MNRLKFKQLLYGVQQVSILKYLLKWFSLSILIGGFVGSASAFFLWSLNEATDFRSAHIWIIALLPVGGLIIGLCYHYWGQEVVKGNNQLLEEFHSPKKIIPFKMAPLVLFGTVLTHLFGGSAGREGTAVQMGGAIADQFSKWFKLGKSDRRIILILGISAGFASVFGTPLAGAVFALEVLYLGRIRYEAILPSFLVAIIANLACAAWNIPHTHYHIDFVPAMSIQNLIWTLIIGIISGLVAMTFSKLTHFWSNAFKRYIKYPPLRPVIGGVIIATSVWLIGTTKFIGLGVPTISDSFHNQQGNFDFLLKLLFTTFTLGAGFKGGEVTPLFFIGATLGNMLSLFIPLPMALAAGMGFVAVFSGATNTPIACTLMAVELFGAESAVFTAMACVVAYLFSGHSGIYSSQIIQNPKDHDHVHAKGKTLGDIG